MNLIQNVIQNWSRYELRTEILLYLSIIAIAVLTIYLFSKNGKITLLSFISLCILLLLNFLGFIIISSLLKIQITEVFRMTPVISLVFLISNLGLLTGYYSSKKKMKEIKFANIRKEYMSDSIKETVFLILLGISTIFFLSPATEIVVSMSILTSIAAIWLTYWISKYILK
jgi:hypothetical protein